MIAQAPRRGTRARSRGARRAGGAAEHRPLQGLRRVQDGALRQRARDLERARAVAGVAEAGSTSASSPRTAWSEPRDAPPRRWTLPPAAARPAPTRRSTGSGLLHLGRPPLPADPVPARYWLAVAAANGDGRRGCPRWLSRCPDRRRPCDEAPGRRVVNLACSACCAVFEQVAPRSARRLRASASSTACSAAGKRCPPSGGIPPSPAPARRSAADRGLENLRSCPWPDSAPVRMACATSQPNSRGSGAAGRGRSPARRGPHQRRAGRPSRCRARPASARCRRAAWWACGRERGRSAAYTVPLSWSITTRSATVWPPPSANSSTSRPPMRWRPGGECALGTTTSVSRIQSPLRRHMLNVEAFALAADRGEGLRQRRERRAREDLGCRGSGQGGGGLTVSTIGRGVTRRMAASICSP